MRKLSLTVPGYDPIQAPGNVPTGGFSDASANPILGWALQVAFAIAILLVLIMLVWGGIQWITSGGDKEKVANARKRIMYSIFGLALILLSVLIINTLLFFFGIPLFGVPYSNPCDVPGEPC